MANKKITELVELTSVDPLDEFIIVDKSDATHGLDGTSKKIKHSNLVTAPTVEETTPADADKFTLWVAGVAYFLTWANLKIAFIPTEEVILGTATYDATLTGAESIDLNTFSTLRGILTGNTTITFTNTPASSKSVVKTMLVTGNFTLTFADADYTIGTYSGTATMNRVTIELSNYPTAGLLVTVTFENIA